MKQNADNLCRWCRLPLGFPHILRENTFIIRGRAVFRGPAENHLIGVEKRYECYEKSYQALLPFLNGYPLAVNDTLPICPPYVL